MNCTLNRAIYGRKRASAHPRFHEGHWQVSIQKCAIFRKFKEIKELRGGILLYAAQAIPPIDAEIAEKGHLWTETS